MEWGPKDTILRAFKNKTGNWSNTIVITIIKILNTILLSKKSLVIGLQKTILFEVKHEE